MNLTDDSDNQSNVDNTYSSSGSGGGSVSIQINNRSYQDTIIKQEPITITNNHISTFDKNTTVNKILNNTEVMCNTSLKIDSEADTVELTPLPPSPPPPPPARTSSNSISPPVLLNQLNFELTNHQTRQIDQSHTVQMSSPQ